MGFTEAIRSVFSNYANFNGRARRSEYWFFVLFNFLLNIVYSIIRFSIVIFSGLDAEKVFDAEKVASSPLLLVLSLIALVISLALLIPGFAVSIRRLHDIGKSGWFILLGLIPLAGPIILFIFYLTDSEIGENMYGPNPKGMNNIYTA